MVLIFTACNFATDEKLNQAERLMKTSVDSSLLVLQGLKPDYPEMEDKDKALFGLLFFQALSISAKELSPVEMIDFSIDYYTRENNKERLAYCYLYKGRMHMGKREYADAIKCFLIALQNSKTLKNDDLLGRIYFALGQISGYQDETDKALDYYEQALYHFEKVEDTENISKVHLIRGWVYLALEDYDAAISSSKKALEITTDSMVIGDVLHDIGTGYYFKDQPDSAIYYMRQSLTYPYFDTNGASRYYSLGNVYSFLDNNDSAKLYINRALQMPIDIYFEEECYRVLAEVALAENDKAGVAKYINKRQTCQDSIKRLETQPNIKLLEQIHKSDIETSQVRTQRLLLVAAVIFLVVAGAIVSFLLHKGKRQNKQEADSYRSELEKKHELLLLDLADELEQTRAKYADIKRKSNFEQREQLEKKIFFEVLRLDDEKAFTDKMNKVLNRLPDKLKIDYPNMTFKDIIWCCLFMLQFSTADISLIMDYKQSSQYKFKQRLSKKLNFNNSKELEEMLHEKMNI